MIMGYQWIYPLVYLYITMVNHSIFNSYVTNYQRVRWCAEVDGLRDNSTRSLCCFQSNLEPPLVVPLIHILLPGFFGCGFMGKALSREITDICQGHGDWMWLISWLILEFRNWVLDPFKTSYIMKSAGYRGANPNLTNQWVLNAREWLGLNLTNASNKYPRFNTIFKWSKYAPLIMSSVTTTYHLFHAGYTWSISHLSRSGSPRYHRGAPSNIPWDKSLVSQLNHMTSP